MRHQLPTSRDQVFHWIGTLSGLEMRPGQGSGPSRGVPLNLVSSQAGDTFKAVGRGEGVARGGGVGAMRSRGGGVEPGRGLGNVGGIESGELIEVGVGKGGGDRGALAGSQGAGTGRNHETRRSGNLVIMIGKDEQRLIAVLRCQRS